MGSGAICSVERMSAFLLEKTSDESWCRDVVRTTAILRIDFGHELVEVCSKDSRDSADERPWRASENELHEAQRPWHRSRWDVQNVDAGISSFVTTGCVGEGNDEWIGHDPNPAKDGIIDALQHVSTSQKNKSHTMEEIQRFFKGIYLYDVGGPQPPEPS